MSKFEFITEDAEGYEITVTLPTHWAICSACRGEGTRALHGIAFTSSEWAEACDGDPDFAEDYMGGRYDTTCEECGGSGKVKEVDENSLTEEQRALWEAKLECDAIDRAERMAEQRWGY